MTALKVTAVILLLLLLAGLVRVGGGGEYSAEGVRAWIKAGPFRVRVFPVKEKKAKRPKKEKKRGGTPSQEEKTEEEPSKGGPVERVKRYLPLVCEAAGELKRRIRIDELRLDYTLGGKRDAAAAAMSFGYSNAALGIILGLFEQNFEVKDRRVRTAVDFNDDKAKIYVRATVSARLGQLVSFALRFGWKFFALCRQSKAGPKNGKKEAS